MLPPNIANIKMIINPVSRPIHCINIAVHLFSIPLSSICRVCSAISGKMSTNDMYENIPPATANIQLLAFVFSPTKIPTVRPAKHVVAARKLYKRDRFIDSPE